MKDDRESIRVSRDMALHFGQGVWACSYCLDWKGGYCRGKGLVGFAECRECIKNHTEVGQC